ncbi:MAG: DegT/DnrJ/EryC1/StrS family aminotransferase [Burkholderiales bacterium]|nr:DegT/DnrJ/EryC1/StrS family aminotransferase [Burkholderiales bacterium]
MPCYPVFGQATFDGPRESPLPCLLDRPGVILTASGRVATALALAGFGIGPGDRVLLPSYHCPTMVTPVLHVGATPIFYALDDNGAPCQASIEAQAADNRPRAIVVAHLFGIGLDLRELRTWCTKHAVVLIEDCAHALFGSVGGQPLGDSGDAAIGSLPKFLPLHEGGCLVFKRPPERRPALTRSGMLRQIKAAANLLEAGSRDSRLGVWSRPLQALFDLKQRLRRTAQYEDGGATPRDGSSHALAAPVTVAPPPPANAWMDEARLRTADMARLPTRVTRWLAARAHRERIVALRRARFAEYLAHVRNLEGVRAAVPILPAGSVPYVFPIVVEKPDQVFAALRTAGVPALRWDRRWPGTPARPEDVATRWSHALLQLPCHQDLDCCDMGHILAICRAAAA